MKSGLTRKPPLVSTLRIDYKACREAVLTYSHHSCATPIPIQTSKV